VRLWNAQTGARLGEPLRGHEAAVDAVAFSPDGARLATGDGQGTARLWNARTGAALGEPLRDDAGDMLVALAFSPDGARLIAASYRGVRQRDAATGADMGQTVSVPYAETSGVQGLSPGGARVIAAYPDGLTRLMDTRTGAQLGLPYRLGRIFAFSADGARAVALSSWREAQVFDVRTGASLGETMSKGDVDISAAAFSPNGEFVVTGFADGVVRVWRLNPALSMTRAQLMAQVCQGLLGPGLSQLSAEELRQAPVLDPRLDADACRPVSVWTRLGAALGLARAPVAHGEFAPRTRTDH
jgi:WD40 repeat protein